MTYGTGTRSYNRSPEKRQMDRERRETTKRHEAQPAMQVEIRWSMCNCRSFRLPHGPEEHKKLLSDFDWRMPSERRGQEIYEPWIY